MKMDEVRDNVCALVQVALPASSDNLMPHRGSEDAFLSRREIDVQHSNAGDHVEGPRITHIDRAIIRNYFREHYYRIIGRTGEMPHAVDGGHQARGSKLPLQCEPGLLDDDLERKLNVLPRGYRRVTIGWDVLLIETATRRIIDSMHNVGIPSMN